ncbi:MAG: hypothetical protein WKG07_09290 [Hymenobacter sp.]
MAERDIMALADPDDKDRDGITGRPNYVEDRPCSEPCWAASAGRLINLTCCSKPRRLLMATWASRAPTFRSNRTCPAGAQQEGPWREDALGHHVEPGRRRRPCPRRRPTDGQDDDIRSTDAPVRRPLHGAR